VPRCNLYLAGGENYATARLRPKNAVHR